MSTTPMCRLEVSARRQGVPFDPDRLQHSKLLSHRSEQNLRANELAAIANCPWTRLDNGKHRCFSHGGLYWSEPHATTVAQAYSLSPDRRLDIDTTVRDS